MVPYGLQWRVLQDYFAFQETANSSAWGLGGTGKPPANMCFVYAKDKSGASHMYFKDDANVEWDMGVPTTVITGTGTANRLAYWTGAQTIDDLSALTQGRVMFPDSNGLPTGDSQFSWDNTNKQLTVKRNGGGGILLDTVASGNPSLDIYTVGAFRWGFGYDASSTGFFIYNGALDATNLFITNAGRVGISKVETNNKFGVNGDIGVDSGFGYKINNAAAAGTFLRGDGTRYGASTLILPNSATANRIAYATSSNTYGESANLAYDGSDFLLGSGTRARMASQNRFRYLNSLVSAKKTTNQTGKTTGTWTTRNWDGTEELDTDGLHDPASNSSRLTAAIAGKYLVVGTISIGGGSVTTPSNAGARFLKNGGTTTTYGVYVPYVGASVDIIVSTSAMISLAASDYVEMQGVFFGGGGTYDLTSSADLERFEMFYVGE